MGWLVAFAYFFAFALLVATDNLWCLFAAGWVLFAVLASVALVIARQTAQQSLENEPERFEVFGGRHGE